MRQYGAIPAPNAADNTPKVLTVTGLGTGGGAGVQTPDSGNFGQINMRTGPAPAAGGNVVLRFPGTPPALFISGSDTLGALTQGTVSNDVTITWAGTPQKNLDVTIHYEWADYKKAN